MDHLHPLWDKTTRQNDPRLGLTVFKRNEMATSSNLEDIWHAVEDEIGFNAGDDAVCDAIGLGEYEPMTSSKRMGAYL